MTVADAIARTLHAYCDAVDANDPADIVALFTPDAVFDFGYGRVFHGHEQLAGLFAGLSLYSATSHHLSNIAIDRAAPAVAHSRSRIYAFHRIAESGQEVQLWGRYSDVLTHTGTRWLIAHRELRAAAETGATAEPGRPGRWEPIARAGRGGR